MTNIINKEQTQQITALNQKEPFIVKRTHFIAIPAILFLLALLPMPYFYYQLMKFYFFLFLTFISYRTSKYYGFNVVVIVTALLAILYNPIIPIRLGDKTIWSVLNFITLATLFWVNNFWIKQGLKQESKIIELKPENKRIK